MNQGLLAGIRHHSAETKAKMRAKKLGKPNEDMTQEKFDRIVKDGKCWPSNTTLAKRLNCSVSQIIRYKKRLAILGIIEPIRVGKRRTNRYRFLNSPLIKSEDYRKNRGKKTAHISPHRNCDVSNIQYDIVETSIGDYANMTNPIVNDSVEIESINTKSEINDDTRLLYSQYKEIYLQYYRNEYPENNAGKDLAQLQLLSERFQDQSSWEMLSTTRNEHLSKIFIAYFEFIPDAQKLGITELLVHVDRLQQLLDHKFEQVTNKSLGCSY